MKRSGILIVSIMLLSLAVGAVSAQMGPAQMGNAATSGGMMGVNAFGNMDSRFTGFSEKAFSQVCSEFGVSEDTAISDLGLPANLNRQMTVAQIQEQYSITDDDIANYMVMHMRQTTASVNTRQMAVMRQQAAQGKRAQGMVQGLQFMRDGNSAYGEYVTYTFDEDGIVRDFAVSGDSIFDSIEVSEFGYTGEDVRGSIARYIGESAIFTLHDNPNAVTQVMALSDISVVFDLADDVEASPVTDDETGTTTIKITKENFEGYLILCANCSGNDVDAADLDIEVTDGTVTADIVEYSAVVFRATPMEPQYVQTQYRYSQGASYMNQKINQGIALGRVGAEVAIRGNSSCILNYTAVNLQLRENIRNRVALSVASELGEGQVITINLDNETIDLTRPERIRLMYDGQQLTCANNIDELFANGTRPLCYMLQENNTASMAVYIPEFSEHEIIIDVEPEPTETGTEVGTETEATTETEEGTTIPAFGIVFATAAVAVAYARQRR